MATWGAYLSSYVKKNPGDTPGDKENGPTSTRIDPLKINTNVKNIEPLIFEEDSPAPTPSEVVKKRFDEKLGSVGNLGMGTPSLTRTPTLKSNSRGARMAKMFGFGTVKEEKAEEKIVEDKGEVETPLDEVKEIKLQFPPEMSKIEKLMAERKAAAIQSRSTSPESNQPTESVQTTKPAQPPPTLQSLEPLKSVRRTSVDSLQQPIPEKSKPTNADTSASVRSSLSGVNSSTSRALTRGKTKASISALDDLMAGFGEEFTAVSVTPKPVENEKAGEKSALERPRNQRKPNASISALDDIMAGLYSMDPAQKAAEIRKVEVGSSGISKTGKTPEVVVEVLPPAPEVLKAVIETPKMKSQTLRPVTKASKAASRFPIAVAGVSRTTPIVTTKPTLSKDQLSPLPPKTQTITTISRSPMINGQLSPLPPQFRLRPKRSFKDMVKLAASSRFVQIAEQAVEAEAERKLSQYEKQAEKILLEKGDMEESRMSPEESFQKMVEEDERIAREAEEVKAFYEEQERIRVETEAEEERLRKEREEVARQARIKREKREAEEREAQEEAERLTAQIKAFEREQEKAAQEVASRRKEEERLAAEEAARRYDEEERLAEIERIEEEEHLEEEERLAEIERIKEEERLEEEERLAYEEQLREEEFEEQQRIEEERIYAEEARRRDEAREKAARERAERIEAQMREEERLRAERDEQERLQMEEEEEERRAYEDRLERQRQRDEREVEMMRRRKEQERIAEQQRFDAQREMERIDMIEREEREMMRMQQERQEAEMDREREEAIRLQQQQLAGESFAEGDNERPLTKEEEIAKAEEKIRMAFAGMAAQKAGISAPTTSKSPEPQFMKPARQLAPRPSIRGGLPGGPRGGVGLPGGPKTGMGLPSGPRGGVGLPARPRMRIV